MKKLTTIIAVVAFAFAANATNTDLIISKYFEGPTGNNKVIEIYNGTGAEVNLSGYTLKQNNISNSGNFNGWADSLVLSGTLANGACYVVAHTDADASFTAKASATTKTGNVMNFNGNDAMGIFKNGTLLDVVGKPGVNETWGTDKYFERKCSVTSPSNTWIEADWGAQTATNSYTTWAALFGSHCGVDLAAPTLVSAVSQTTTTVVVTFNEAVSEATAQTAGNYSINNGITVSAAVIASPTVVTLTVSALTQGSSYTLTVTGVQDLAGNAMSATSITIYNPGVTPVADLAGLWDAFGDDENGSWDENGTTFTGTTIYEITGPVAVTAIGTQRGQKWVQDYGEDGFEYAVLIDDPNGKITSTLAVGNTVTGLKGTCTYYYDLVEFVPVANVIADAQPAFEVEPVPFSLDEFADEDFQYDYLWGYQSCLAILPEVYFKNNNTTLANGKNYAMCNEADGEVIDSAVRIHIYNTVTYTTNATKSVDITGVLVIDRNTGFVRISPRTTADIKTEGATANEKTVTRKNVALQLSPVPVKDQLTVTMTEAVSVDVYAFNGTLVAQKQGINGSTTINVAPLASGIYFVKATDKNGKISMKKFIKR